MKVVSVKLSSSWAWIGAYRFYLCNGQYKTLAILSRAPSSGNRIVLDNFVSAFECGSRITTVEIDSIDATLLAEGAVRGLVFPPGYRYILVPQNAWVYSDLARNYSDLVRQMGLRFLTTKAVRNSLGTVRISKKIPSFGKSCTSVISNVVDVSMSMEKSLAYDLCSVFDLPNTIVVPGSITCYRNLHVLSQGYLEYRKNGGERNFLIVGNLQSKCAFTKLIAAVDGGSGVKIITKWIERLSLLSILEVCCAVVLPSPVEAYTVGKRVLVSDIVGHREIYNTEQLNGISWVSGSTPVSWREAFRSVDTVGNINSVLATQAGRAVELET